MSFSNYSGMKACFLKGLPLSCICFSEKPPLFLKSKAQLLGIFLHAMLEKIFELRKYDRSERSNLLKVAFDVELLKFEKQFAEHSWRLGTDSISKLPEIGKIFDQLSQIVFSKNIYGNLLFRINNLIPFDPINNFTNKADLFSFLGQKINDIEKSQLEKLYTNYKIRFVILKKKMENYVVEENGYFLYDLKTINK